jgi:hypothetical protein
LAVGAKPGKLIPTSTPKTMATKTWKVRCDTTLFITRKIILKF